MPRNNDFDLNQYRALVENAPMMVWRTGIHAEFDYFNAAWLAFTGRRLEHELGTGWLEGVHVDDLRHWRAFYRDHFEDRQAFTIEYRLRRFDGEYRIVSQQGAPYTDESGAFAGFIGSALDKHDSRTRESSSADQCFEMSLDNMCIAGFDGYFKRLNPSWTRTLGWTAEELKSRPSVEFVHPEDRAKTLAGRDRLKDGDALGPLINRYLCKDGSFRWFEWRSVADRDRRLVYAVARDITEQKLTEDRLRAAHELQEKLERQLIFADRMASVGTLAAGVAHEINNPLAYASANIDLIIGELRSLGPESPATRFKELVDMAFEAQSGTARIRKIVHGLKTFSRAEEGRRAVIDIQPLLELSISMTHNEIRHRAQLIKDYGPLPSVEADEARLGQVFINLLVNAAQAMPEGDHAANEIRIITATDDRGRAVIEVRDTGSGIPQAIIDRVFDPFFTTKPVGIGTGLGLSISHNIVSSMGGELSVESAEGRGTTFRVVLPPAISEAPRARATASAVKHAKARAVVLVVDDEPAIGVVLCRILRDHDVTSVTSARQALALLNTGKRFDVIFSDLMMPEISGMEFYDELARLFPDLRERVVFMSGGAFTTIAKAFLDRVPNQRVDKPFDPQELRDIVRRFVQ